MSQPNEPRFEDDFFNEPSDDDPQEQWEDRVTIEDIANNKAWNYTLEYDKTTGTVSTKRYGTELKEAYKAGFLEGFTHRLTEPQLKE